MRHSFSMPVTVALFVLAVRLSAAVCAQAADKPAPKPKPDGWSFLPAGKAIFDAPPGPKPASVCDKLKEIGTHLGRALDVAVGLLSGNEAELLSGNRTALLSGNSPKLLSGNKPEVLSGNKPTVLSGNQTPILSGNKISLFSNLKIEIHIENSGNSLPPPQPSASRSAESRRDQPAR